MMVGSASPRMPLNVAKSTAFVDRPPPMHANDHTTIPTEITGLGPNLSTRIPEIGYIIA